MCGLSVQAFGEIREMRRGPNGNVYVDFKKANVADTVRSPFLASLPLYIPSAQ